MKFIVFDFDGVFTDGKIYYTNDGTQMKYYNVRDGQGISLLRKKYKIGLISSHDSTATRHIANHLKFNKISIGNENKLDILNNWIRIMKINYDDVCYIGDDIVDIPIMEKVKMSICPNDAVDDVKKICNYICKSKGGYGAVREICEMILFKNKS